MCADEEKFVDLGRPIVNVGGRPKSPVSRSDLTKWEWFRNWLSSRLAVKRTVELDEAFAQGSTAPENSDAEERCAQGAMIAAEKENKEEEVVDALPARRETSTSAEKVEKHSFWKAVKYLLFPKLRRAEELAKAVVKIKTGSLQADADLAKLRVVSSFNSIVDDIWKDDNLSKEAKFVKLAKLMEQSPGLVDQMDKVYELIDRLNRQKGLLISTNDNQRRKSMEGGDVQ